MIDFAQQIMGFRILWSQGDGQLERFNGSLVSALHLKNAAELIVRLWKLRIVADGFPKILFRFGQSI